ncbi:MAG TPA: chemotaxis protein CheW [Candidatus Acidoferrum sp.]|nr:chemotaxis protein CheW [Candidatus Acidoferrum sp.]
MRLAAPAKASSAKTEQIILFRVSGQLFAVSSASVQEVRSVDSMSGAAIEISAPGIRKVRHVVRRGDRSLFIVNGAMHFGLHAAEGALLFVLRKTRTALLIDGIDKMTTMTRLQALPLSFCHEERYWYRGLTALDQTVVPVVNPEGFLSPEELALLDAALLKADNSATVAFEETGLAQ